MFISEHCADLYEPNNLYSQHLFSLRDEETKISIAEKIFHIVLIAWLSEWQAALTLSKRVGHWVIK